jgi:predicted component of type VI protein secretion system
MIDLDNLPPQARKLVDDVSAAVAKLDDEGLVNAALNCMIARIDPEHMVERFHADNPECAMTFTKVEALMSAAITAACIMREQDKREEAAAAAAAAARAKMN